MFVTTAFEEAHTFATEALGLEQSDWLQMEIAEGIELEVRFYHCNARHHTLALAKSSLRSAAEAAITSWLRANVA